MKKFMAFALAATSCIMGSNSALAAYVTWVSSDGLQQGSWHQSLTPTPLAYAIGDYTTVAITDATGVVSPYTSVIWYNVPGVSSNGGLDIGGSFGPVNSTGEQSYATSPSAEAAPIFVVGTYVENDGSIVTISVPEPATWAMMLVGLGAIGFAIRRRRNVSVTYA